MIQHRLKYLISLAVLVGLMASCTDDVEKPVLRDSSTFVPPVLKNAPTADPVVFLPEDASNLFEKFEWERTGYGISLATNYVLEIDTSESFSNPQRLRETTADSARITVANFNNAMLALGLPGFEESTVYLRVKSTIVGYDAEPKFSEVVSRTATTYQSSECGNFCTIGLIGSATAGGWDNDTDMRIADPEKVDLYTWTVTVYLNEGAVKFRANDGWDDNWGAEAFPEGTGTAGGPDIPVSTAGYYKVTFNDNTGEYSFTSLSAPEFGTIGVIGDATPGGWDSDTDLTQDEDDPHLWTGTITLTDGNIKFRADDDWATNWGSTTFPSGYGIGGGADIPATAGTYFVWFHDVTGEYALMPDGAEAFASIGVIGTAQAGGWDSDTDMIQNPANPFKWSKLITISEGLAKFRANDGWDDNWGGTTFPGGTGTPGGPDIPTMEGTYFVTFHTGTGEYYFLK